MAVGESFVQRQARLERQRKSYPELGSTDVSVLARVDSLRRREGRPLTTFGQAAEDSLLGMHADQINSYGADVDAAPNRTDYTPGPLGRAMKAAPAEEEPWWAGAPRNRDDALALSEGLRPPELTDPLAKRTVEGDAKGYLGQLIDAGGPARGIAVTAMQGRNPFQASRTEDITQARGIDVGAVDALPDRGLKAGPLHLTPKTVAGFALESAVDPSTYVGVGRLKGAAGAAKDLKGAQRAATVPFVESASPSRRMFGLTDPTVGISKFDEALNAIKRTVGIGVEEDDVATPIMRARKTAQRNVESQAALMGAVADETTRAFKMDKAGRITDLPGAPTIQDVAARLPQYDQYLDDAQRKALERLRAEIAPYTEALAENGVEVRSRADVMDGGFYLPRGRAAEEGADEAVKVRTGRGGAGGKKGFERGATFESMTEGIEAGYEYAAFRDAVQSYAQDAGTRTIDKWAGDSFKATGLGEGVKERLMREQPNLVREWDEVNQRIAQVRSKLATAEKRGGVAVARTDELDNALEEVARAQPTGGAAPLARIPTALRTAGREADALSDSAGYGVLQDAAAGAAAGKGEGMNRVVERLAALVPEGTERVRFLDTAIARTERRIEELAKRGGKYANQAKALRTELDALYDHYQGIAGEYKRAFEHAAMTPRDQGSIGFGSLNGTTFPDEIANVANKYLNAEKKATGRGTGPLNAVQATNTLMRGIRATADVSFMGIQGLLGAASHPIAYSKALSVALKSLGDERALGAFVKQFDEGARAAGLPDSRQWAARGLHIGGSNTEFAVGRGLGRVGDAIQNDAIPLTGKIPGLRDGLNPARGSNRAFGTFGDTLRLLTADSLYKARAGRNVADSELADITRFSNLMTGWSQRRFGSEWGDLLQFAPRFFSSQLEMVGAALGQKGVAGDEARKSLGALVGVGTLLTFAANEARGKDTDFKPGSPNFMRIRDVAGQDISLFGPWDSLIRGLAAAGQGDLTYMARSKASPSVALAWDYLSGEDFRGERTRDNPQQAVEHLLKQFVPFSASGIVEGDSPAGTAIGFTGLKTATLSATDRVQEGEYDQLRGDDQFKAIRPQAWRAIQEQAPDEIKAEVSKYDSYYDWEEATRKEFTKQATAEARQRGIPEGMIAPAVERAINASRVRKGFLKASNYYENEWIEKNPKDARKKSDEASKQLEKGERPEWSPTNDQRKAIYR